MDRISQSLKTELGYRRVNPPAPEEVEGQPFWQAEPEGPVESIVEEILEAEWHVDHLREEIENLGIEPKGRTRRALAQQMAERFLDPARLVASVQKLSDEELRYYVTLQLQANLSIYYTTPRGQALWKGFSTPWPKMATRVAKLGLALTMEDGQLYLPRASRQGLTMLQLPFPTASPPRTSANPSSAKAEAPAGDGDDQARLRDHSRPRDEVLVQIQQLLNLLQVETFKLRGRLVWQAPEYPYAEPLTCWPPVPADARALRANVNSETEIELYRPEHSLDDAALDRWMEVLDVTEDRAEFLYHVLVAAGIILKGSPLTVDPARVREWMALTPGRQLGILFQSYLQIAPWAVWWPLWREGSVRVARPYHGYWSLASVDQAVYQAARHLRWTLIELLSFLPENGWLATADVVAWLVDLFPTPDTHRYLMGLNLEDQSGGWAKFLEEALLMTIMGPLQT